MIIRTKVETRQGGMKTAYYKHMGSNGRAILGSKTDAASFDPQMAATILSHLKTIDARFAQA